MLFMLLILLAPEFEDDVNSLSQLRNGRNTPLQVVGQRGESLLNKYSDPKKQALIYYHLAHIHAQSGLSEPERVIEYSREALQLPLEQEKRLRLFVYYGDALQVMETKTLTERRKDAARIYSEGLAELREYRLPDRVPDAPKAPRFEDISPPVSFVDEQELKKRILTAPPDPFKTQRILVKHRNVLENQIVELYTREPLAPIDELKRIASEHLQDAHAVARLTKAVEGRVSKMGKVLPAYVETVEEGTSSMFLLIWVGSLVMVVVGSGIIVFLIRRARRHRL